MGILFLYFDPDGKFSQYKLIMAHNRDRSLGLETRPADWSDDDKVMSGLDKLMGDDIYQKRNSILVGTTFGITLTGLVGAVIDIEGENESARNQDDVGSSKLKSFLDVQTLSNYKVQKSDKISLSPFDHYFNSLNKIRETTGYSEEPFQIITGQCDLYYYEALANRIKNVAFEKVKHMLPRSTNFMDSGIDDGDSTGVDSFSNRRSSENFCAHSLSPDNQNKLTESEEKDNGSHYKNLDLSNGNERWRFDYTNTHLGIHERLEPGVIHGFCSSRKNPHPISNSGVWKKVQFGKNELNSIIKKYGCDLFHHDLLVKNILELMKTQDHFWPDTEMESEFNSLNKHKTEAIKKSSIFLNPFNIKDHDNSIEHMSSDIHNFYGTRSISIVTIDSKDNVDYLECNLQYPTCLKNLVWNPTKFAFNLKVGKHIK